MRLEKVLWAGLDLCFYAFGLYFMHYAFMNFGCLGDGIGLRCLS
jgi:hypothetical protein